MNSTEDLIKLQSESITINFNFWLHLAVWIEKRKRKGEKKNLKLIFHKLTIGSLMGFWLRISFKLMLMHVATEPQTSIQLQSPWRIAKQAQRSVNEFSFHTEWFKIQFHYTTIPFSSTSFHAWLRFKQML